MSTYWAVKRNAMATAAAAVAAAGTARSDEAIAALSWVMACHVMCQRMGSTVERPHPDAFFFFSHVAPRLSLANVNAVSVFFSLTAQPAPALFQPVKAFRRWFSRQIRRAVV